MFSRRERGIIERCYSVSFWNYRAAKSASDGKVIESSAFSDRVREEIRILEGIILHFNGPEQKVEPPVEKKRSKWSEFFSWIMGRDVA